MVAPVVAAPELGGKCFQDFHFARAVHCNGALALDLLVYGSWDPHRPEEQQPPNRYSMSCKDG